MGFRLLKADGELMQSDDHYFIESGAYAPLQIDAQAMALMKKFDIQSGKIGPIWRCQPPFAKNF